MYPFHKFYLFHNTIKVRDYPITLYQIMDVLCYEELLSEVIESFNLVTDTQDETIIHCNKILEDCKTCIAQTFYLVTDKTEKSTDEKKLCTLLENCITVLKLLGPYLQNLVKSIPISCCTMKLLPTTTGNIIYEVFKHCKDSECTYGVYLRGVEFQLKDLFRTCHELQMIYLMIFEKYYVIDLDVKEEQEVLLASLDIYLKICDIVQGLDVKTMAEQWKAYTAICEKYAMYLCNTQVFDNCIEYIVATVKTNVTLESIEDEKAVVRSLKVGGFIIKVLSKLCNIFMHSNYNYEKILELFLCILAYKNELHPGQFPQQANLMDSLILSPVDNLCGQVMDEEFLNYFTSRVESKPWSGDMSYVLVLATILRHNTPHPDAVKLMECLFTMLPRCHVAFASPSRFKLGGGTCELYEYLLAHVTAFATAFTTAQYSRLEKLFFEALLRTDELSAMFASDAWTVLCRNNSQLHLNTLTNLIRNYQKLEPNKMFQTSPQRRYILHTIHKMFKVLPYDDKILIYRQFNVQDGRNRAVWGEMMVNLPDNVRNTAENILREQCLGHLGDFLNLKSIKTADFNSAIQHMNLISNCASRGRALADTEDCLVHSWLKCCPNSGFLQKGIIDSISFKRYIESLAHWTSNCMERFQNSTNLEKILHVVSTILEAGNIETTLILFELYCQLLWDTNGMDDGLLEDIFLIDDKDHRNFIFAICTLNITLDDFVSNSLSKDMFSGKHSKDQHSNEILNKYLHFKNNEVNLQSDHLESTFVHKCPNMVEVKACEFSNIKNNFNEDKVTEAEQPLTKKAKMELYAIENIIVDMERNATQLYTDRASLSADQKTKLQSVCVKLKSIIS